jgi:transposase
MAFSIDLRERVIAAVDRGTRITDLARLFQIERKTIYRWLDRRKKTGSLARKSGYQKGHSHKITDWEKFREFAEINKNLTSSKMALAWEKTTGVQISKSVIKRALKKIGFTSKKKLLGTQKQMPRSVNNFQRK